MNLLRKGILLAAALLIVPLRAPAPAAENRPPLRGRDTTGIAGTTWTGESICVGDRPACRNEVVVYRFMAVYGRADLVTLYADKIIEGKRVPMYKLDFVYDREKGRLSGEFTRRQTRGIWLYQISADQLEGTLMLLPEKKTGRRVKVHRVSEDRVPKAPPLSEYEARVNRDGSFNARAE